MLIQLLPSSAVATGVRLPLSLATEPAMISNENRLLTGYVYIEVAERDPGSYVGEANQLLRDHLRLPTGYSIAWCGQYEVMEPVKERRRRVVPITLFLICLLLFMNTRSIPKTIIILLAVPFSAVGAIWFLYLAGYQHERSCAGGIDCLVSLVVEPERGTNPLRTRQGADRRGSADGLLFAFRLRRCDRIKIFYLRFSLCQEVSSSRLSASVSAVHTCPATSESSVPRSMPWEYSGCYSE